MNLGGSFHCFRAFSDQDVFICTDQNRAEVMQTLLGKTLLAEIFQAPDWVGVAVHSMGRCHGKIKIRNTNETLEQIDTSA